MRYFIVLFLLSSFPAMAVGPSMLIGGLSTRSNCLELHSNWTPQYASITQYLKLNGKTAAVADATTIPAAVGSAGLAGNANASGLSYVTGQLGQALSFDGVDDIVQLQDNINAETTVYTVAFWMKPLGSTAAKNGVFMRGDGNNCFYNPAIYMNNSTGVLTIAETGCSGSGVLATPTISTTAWTHVAVTRNGSTLGVYVNGSPVTVTGSVGSPFGGYYTGAAMTIGAVFQQYGLPLNSEGAGVQYPNPPQYALQWQGLIDEVGVWSVALTSAEVLKLYNGQVCN